MYIIMYMYISAIQIHCINHAMIALIQHPPPGFEDVVRTHFYLKKDLILQVCDLTQVFAKR